MKYLHFPLLSISIILALFTTSYSTAIDHPLKDKKFPSGIFWIQNGGQFDDEIAFASKTRSSRTLIDQEGAIIYYLKHGKEWVKVEERPRYKNPGLSPRGLNERPGNFHFIKGSKKHHRSNIKSFNDINLGEIWNGIEIILHSTDQNIEKIIEIDKHANPDQIDFELSGVKEICINADEELQMDINEGSLFFTKPIAWQIINEERVPIKVSYKTKNGKSNYGFEIGQYDKTESLFIDPLISSGLIGGSMWDFSQDLKVGKNGKIYVCGITESFDMPWTVNSFDPVYNDTTDIFVALFNANLSVLEACTFFGGESTEFIKDMVLDPMDNVYFTGQTQSEDFPVSATAYDQSYNNPGDEWFSDMFVSALSPDLKQLMYSTYVGGSRHDFNTAIDLDSENNVILSGNTLTAFPVVGPQFYNTTIDVVIYKMDETLNHMIATNSLQGNNYFRISDIAVDSSDNIFFSGDSRATNLPTTLNSFANLSAGKRDIYVVRTNNDLSQVLAGTYIGGMDDESVYGITTDILNNLYLTGETNSEDFPVSQNAYDKSREANSLDTDVIVCKFDSTLKNLLASTFLGGSNSETGYDLALDSMYNILVTGYTITDFPVFCNSYDSSPNGNHDAFISRLSPNLDSLLSSTYIGGSGSDHSYTIELNKGDTVYTAGYTTSENFPTRLSFQTAYNGGLSDGFVLSIDPKLDQEGPCCPALIYPLHQSTDLTTSMILEWDNAVGAEGYNLKISSASGTSLYDPIEFMDLGNVTSYQLDALPCEDTIFVKLQSYNEKATNFDCSEIYFTTVPPSSQTEVHEICKGDSFEWQGSFYDENGIYQVDYLDMNGCDSIHILELSVLPSNFIIEKAEICQGDSVLWQNEYFKQEGIHQMIYENIYSCDSIRQLDLLVNDSYDLHFSESLCPGETLIWEGQELNETGLYTASYISQHGCDSLLSMDITVQDIYSYTANLSFCEGESIEWQQNTYSEAGDYMVVYESIYGCDSIYNLHLTTAPDYHFDEEKSFCEGEVINWQGTEISVQGEYFASYESINGCDSIYQLIVKKISPDTSINFSGDSLWVSEDIASSYQWITCPDLLPISGATESTFIAASSGSFAVIVEKEGCVDTSACHAIIHSNTRVPVSNISFSVYPNPSKNDFLRIHLENISGTFQIRLIDPSGQILFKGEKNESEIILSTDGLESGIYFIDIQSKNKNYIKKIVISN